MAAETAVPSDLLDLYMQEIARVPLLTADDEAALAKQIEAGREAEKTLAAAGNGLDLDAQTRGSLERTAAEGQQAFDRFVSSNLRLVVKFAADYARRSRLSLDELIQEGNLGLIRAVEKFDWRRGLKFSTYATWWIRQALQRGTAHKERTIRLPAGIHANLLKVRAAQARLVVELDRPPTVEELSEGTNLTESEVHKALSADFAVTSLDTPVTGEPDAAELGALIARATDQPAEEVVDRLFVEGVMEAARTQLPERSWYVLQRRYGLEGHEPATLQAVGQDLGLSREAIRKIEQQALARLAGIVDAA